MAESAVWKMVKRNVPGLWQRLENSNSQGWPDTVGLLPCSTVVWIELKDLTKWKKTLGLRRHQVLWLRRWCRRGGNAYVFARYKKAFFLVQGSDILDEGSLEDWTAVATAVWTGAVNWQQFTQLISTRRPSDNSK